MRKQLAAAAALPRHSRCAYLGYFAGAMAVQATFGLTAVATRFVQVSFQHYGSGSPHLQHFQSQGLYRVKGLTQNY
jgi:hypothetical protein